MRRRIGFTREEERSCDDRFDGTDDISRTIMPASFLSLDDFPIRFGYPGRRAEKPAARRKR